MLKHIIHVVTIVFLSTSPLLAERVLPTGRHIAIRDQDSGTIPRYQAGYLARLGGSLSSILVDNAGGGNQFERAIELPDAFRVIARGPAVSFDGRVAVIVNATDRHGRVSLFIAFYDMQGTLEKTVRTGMFVPKDLGFTADGSLWAIGKEIEGRSEKEPHDILRQYDAEGRFVRSLIPRNSVSTGREHPMRNASIATSRNYIGILSNTAKTWTLLSSEGLVVGSGSLGDSRRERFFPPVVTDSGRMFVHLKSTGSTGGSLMQVVEVDRKSSFRLTRILCIARAIEV